MNQLLLATSRQLLRNNLRLSTAAMGMRSVRSQVLASSSTTNTSHSPQSTTSAPAPGTSVNKSGNQVTSDHENVDMQHFKKPTDPNFWPNPMGSPVYTKEEVLAVQKTHVPARSISDRMAYRTVKFARWSFDTLSGYRYGELTEDKVFKRAIFLETVAGVPGFVAGILRHLQSLRRMERDYGWIHTLLMEAENERMHLLTFIKLKRPSWVFRMCVLVAQGVFMNGFFIAYLVSPKFCHRFVGYLEEEAVKTYSDILLAIDDGRLDQLKYTRAPEIAISYWRLDPNASVRDLVLAVRADEANHRDVNHTFADLKPGQKNPNIH